jgi:hypothetical protein
MFDMPIPPIEIERQGNEILASKLQIYTKQDIKSKMKITTNFSGRRQRKVTKYQLCTPAFL